MATSGVSILQLSRDDILNAVLRKLGVIGEGQTGNATQLSTAAQALNNVVAEFRTLGMSIWARKTYQLTPVAGTNSYTFGVGQTVNIPYPLRIYVANFVPGPTPSSQIEMNQLSFVDFAQLPVDSTGTPVNFMYQPKINQGILTVWPTPDTSVPTGSYIYLEFQSPFEYFTTGVDTPDFPEEWNNALIYHTALALTDEYGVADNKFQRIEKLAKMHLDTALSGGAEEASLFFQRDWVGDY